MSKIVVIGCNSFSGSYVVDRLLDDKENQIIGIDREAKGLLFLPYLKKNTANFRFFEMDLNLDMKIICDLLETEQPDYIMNLAALSEVAPSWEHPDQWYETNVVALTKLVNFIKNLKGLKNYTHISSPEVYGTCEGIVKEDARMNPSTPYAASKAAADFSLFTFYKNFNFPLVVMRATNVYGAHQQLFKIIPRSVIYIKMGKKIQLHGGGTAVKSYIHIRDAAQGYIDGMFKGRAGEIYHLSPDRGVAVKDVVSEICEIMGKNFGDATEVVAERLGQDKAYVIDSAKTRTEFNWSPKVSLKEGLNEVVEWVEKYWDEIQRQPLEYIHRP